MWAQLLLYTGSCVYHDCGIHWPTLSDMQMSQREIGTRVSVTMTLTGLYHSVASHTQCRYTFTASKQCSREFVGPYPFHLFFWHWRFHMQIGSPGSHIKGSPPLNTYISSILATFCHAPGILTKIWTTCSRSPACLHGPISVLGICALAWITCTPSRCAYYNYLTEQNTEMERPYISQPYHHQRRQCHFDNIRHNPWW